MESADTLSAIVSATTTFPVPNAAVPGTNNLNLAETTSTAAPGKQKRKRNRLILSCLPCHDRKQQCDRGKPCSRCMHRGAPNDCRYHIDSVDESRKSSKPRTESEEQTTETPTPITRAIRSTLLEMDPSTLMSLQNLVQLVRSNSFVPGIPTSDSLLERGYTDHNVQVAAAALGQLSQQHVSNVSGSSSTINPMAQMLRHINHESAQLPSESSEVTDLRKHFPNEAVTSYLLFYFFDKSSVPWLTSYLHRPLFDSCYCSFSLGDIPPSMGFIALLAIVCASSLQYLPKSAADLNLFVEYEAGREVLQKRLYDFSCSVLHNDAPTPTIEKIQGLALLAQYELNEGNFMAYYNTAGAAIRAAQFLNLNRDGSALPNLTPIDSEIRRRLWWSLYVLDRYQCILLSRPYTIQEQHCDVKIPCNLDQLELKGLPHAQEKPLNELTEQTFHNLQIRLAQVLGTMYDRCFATQLPTYQDILGVEAALQALEYNLPPAFHSSNNNATAEKPYLFWQCHFLTLRIHHAYIILLRYFMLQPNIIGSGNEPALAEVDQRGKLACIARCKQLLSRQLLVAHEKNRPEIYWAETAVRLFDVAVAVAVAIISHPVGNGGLEELITITHGVLIGMGSSNAWVAKVVESVDVLRRYVRGVLRGDSDWWSALPLPKEVEEYREALAIYQEEHSLRLYENGNGMAPAIVGAKVGAFARNIPRAEQLGEPDSIGGMKVFLDGCREGV